MRILVIRAEEGRIVEKEYVEGDLAEVAKKVAAKALEEWDPETSDFVVLRDQRDVEIPPELVNPKNFDVFREFNLRREKTEEGTQAVITVPLYTISFDNISIGDEAFIEKKIYLIVPSVIEEIDVLFEQLAADITSPQAQPEGIEEV